MTLHTFTTKITLTEEQKQMLTMSEADIAEGRIIEQSVLHEREMKWLKGIYTYHK